MVLLKSDYLPAILNKSILEYRPDKDPRKFVFLPRGSKTFSMTRSIYDESGSFLTMNWTADIFFMQQQHNNGSLRLAGKERIGGRDCYVLEFFSFNNGKDFKLIKKDLESKGIPSDINLKLYKFSLELVKKNFSKVKYWIDEDKFIIVKKEEYIDNKLYSSKLYKDIEINNLRLKDF